MEDSDLIKKAEDTIRRNGNKRSTSLLQRELGVGYAQATRLLDALEAQGVVEPLPPSPSSTRRNDKVPAYLLQEAAIGIAYMHGSISPARLEHDLEISYPVAAHLVDSLEENNIIQRDGDKVRWTLNDAWRGFGEEDLAKSENKE